MVTTYKDLRVWQTGMELVTEIYKVSALFPSAELYGLASQIRRAAISVPSNIAEGHARGTTRTYLYHINIAYGSLAEVETQLIIAEKLDFIKVADSNTCSELINGLGKMLKGLQKSLQTKLIPNPEPLTPDPVE